MKKALVVVFSPLLFKMWVKCVGNEEKLQNGTMEKHFFLISDFFFPNFVSIKRSISKWGPYLIGNCAAKMRVFEFQFSFCCFLSYQTVF